MDQKFTMSKWSRGLFMLAWISFSAWVTPANAQVDVTSTGGTPAASYTNLSSAFTAINNGTHTGSISVGISASFTDVAPSVLNSSGAGTASYTDINVHPTVDGVTMSFATATGRGVIELNGADNVTIDGDNPMSAGTNRNLTITNTSANTITFTSAIRIATSGTAPYTDNNNIIIRNAIINGSGTGLNIAAPPGTVDNTMGIVVGPNGGATISALTSSTATVATGVTVNGFTVDNCAINACGRAINFLGNTSASSTGVSFINNLIGDQAAVLTGAVPFTTPTTTVYVKGIFVRGTNAVAISGNSIKAIMSYSGSVPISGVEFGAGIGTGTLSIANNNISGVAQNGANAINARGIWLTNAAGAYTIASNTINNVQGVFTGFSGTTYCAGIEVTTSAPSAVIEFNNISKIHNRCANTLGAHGIQLSGGSAVSVRNNFISDVNFVMTGGAAFDSQYDPNGIRITAGNNHKIYYNTVVLSGTYFGTATTSILSSCLAITSTTTTGIDVRNNIFSNTLGGAGASSAGVCLFLPVSGTSAMNLTINNNAYFTGSTAGYSGIAHAGTTYTATPAGPAGYAGLYTAANFNPLATTPTSNLRAYTSILAAGGTNDNASFATTTAVPLISATNLHIDNVALNAVNIDGKAAVIAGVTTDIDGTTRNAATPDIGADEFNLPPCAGAVGGTAATGTATICFGQTSTITATGATVGGGITYQWEISTTGGGVGFANVTGGTGASTTTYTTSNALAAGTYFLRLNVTCATGPVTGYSNEITITVNPAPTVSITPTSPTRCDAEAPTTLTASGAATYTWAPATGLSATTGASVTTSATNTITYTVTGTSAMGCLGSTPVTVTVTKTPSLPVITPASPSICSGGNINLTATSSYPGTPVNMTLGSGVSVTTINNTSAADYPNTLHHYYGGNKHQMLITAAELTALGMGPGTVINSIGFQVAFVNSTETLQSYMVKMGHSVLTSITAFQSGLTTVRAAANYNPVTTPGVSTISFDTPFTWNGTDNVIIETSFSNNDAPSTGNVTMTYGTTPYQSTIVYRVDNTLGSVVNAYTGAQSYSYSARPNIVFNFSAPVAVTGTGIQWSPATGLSAATGNTVNANPATTTTYTVTAMNGACASAGANVTVNVGAPLVCTGITAPAGLVCAGVNFNLTQNITGGGAPFTYAWSDGVGGVYPNAASITPNLPAGTYNFSVLVTDNCLNTCTSNVTVVVNPNGGSITGPATGVTYQALTYVASGYAAGATFQWQSATVSGGPYTNIPGATNDSLVANSNGAGTFYIVCVITSPGGCITTTNQVTTVITVAGDNVCSAVPLNPGLNGPFTNVGATTQTGEAVPTLGACTGQGSWCSASGGISNTVWFSFVAPASGKASIHFVPGTWDSEIAVWSAPSCGALLTGGGTMIAANDDSSGVSPYNSFIDVTCLIPGNTYYVQVDGYSTTTNNNFGLFLKTSHINAAPVIAGTPSNILMNNDAGTCGAVVTWTAPTVSDADNCIASLSTFTSTHNSGDVFPVGTTTVTYTAMDGVNTVTSTFDVTVNDNELPVIAGTPTDITIAANAAGCTAMVTWAAPTSSDNCSSMLVSSHNSGDVFPQGTTTVTYTASDPSGNETTNTFNVTVTTDLLAALTTSADASCNGSNDGSVDVTTSGMSTPYTFDWNSGTFNTEDLSSIVAGNYELIVTDANGCSDTLMVTINEPAAIASSQTLNICDGQSVTVGSSTYNSNGTYTDVLTATNGCDSTVTTILTVNAPVNIGTSTSLSTITASSATGTYQWINCATMAPISGETNQSYTATADGDYAVIVTESGCSDTTACVNITGTGIQGLGGLSFGLYPNPTSGLFTITSAISGQMSLVNALGEVVTTGKLNKGANLFDAANIARGIYMVRISDVNGNLLHIQRLTIAK